jgi:polyferredoxin
MIFENIPRLVGMLYAISALVILVYFFYSGRFSRLFGYVFLGVSALMGFLIFAPMFPNQFQVLLLGDVNQLGAPLQIALLGLVVFIILTVVFGRIFCGYLCPVGAVQELVYLLPVKKFRMKNKLVPVVFHLLFFMVFFVLAVVFSVGVLGFFGVNDFFNLIVGSVFFYIFLVLVAVSIFVYRPFCRLFCPYGFLLLVGSRMAWFKLGRTVNCVECRKCEKVCPTNEAARADGKEECYMCYRCGDVCPVDAVKYDRQQVEHT